MRIALGASLLGGFILGASLGASCKTPPAPPPAPTPVTADQVTGELVEAGCLAPGSSSAITAELLDVDAHDQGLRRSILCLFDGGSVVSCQIPCK